MSARDPHASLSPNERETPPRLIGILEVDRNRRPVSGDLVPKWSPGCRGSQAAATPQPPGCHPPATRLPRASQVAATWPILAASVAATSQPPGCRGCPGWLPGWLPRQPRWQPGRRGVAATDRGGCQACTRRRHARLREPRLERPEDDYDVALEGDHHRQDVARSKADTQSEHAGAPGMRVSCRTTPRPSHRSAPSAQADF